MGASATPRSHSAGGAWLAALLLAHLSTLPPALAQEAPRLRLPLDCVPGESCWIANHVDLDPGPGARDYACGGMTYDGHNGTDIALRDLRAVGEGVRVLAAAPGTVAAVRDGVPDADVRQRGLEAVAGKECGNGVRIEHSGGWQTQYCHLRRGSIAVRPGERVEPGTVLGAVGLSGKTEFPHLHLTVRHGGRVVDPVRGEGAAAGCGAGERPLWDRATLEAFADAPGALYNFGVAGTLPSEREARAGDLRSRALPADAPALAAWVEAFGVEPGDVLEITVAGPDGASVIAHRSAIDRRQARIFRAVARKRGAALWPPGEYQVRIALARAAGGTHSARFAAQVR